MLCSAFFVGELVGFFGVETFMNRYGRRNIMNALLKIFFVIIVVSLPIPCDAGTDLSDEDATGIIKAHF